MSETQNTISVSLGGRTFNLRPFTLRQLRDVMPLLDKVRGLSPTSPEAIDALAGVVSIALRRDAPDMTTDAVLDLEAGVMDLVHVAREAAKLSGLEMREAKPGEASAGTMSPLTSVSSTDG